MSHYAGDGLTGGLQESKREFQSIHTAALLLRISLTQVSRPHTRCSVQMASQWPASLTHPFVSFQSKEVEEMEVFEILGKKRKSPHLPRRQKLCFKKALQESLRLGLHLPLTAPERACSLAAGEGSSAWLLHRPLPSAPAPVMSELRFHLHCLNAHPPHINSSTARISTLMVLVCFSCLV